ncbi:MAG: endolytic transglycosylase MltG [Clostridia bacterium]
MTAEKRKKKRKRVRIPHGVFTNIGRLLWLAFIVFVVLLFLWAYNLTYGFVMERESTDIPALVGTISDEDAVKIFIPMGSSTKRIAEILEEEGFISDARIFNIYSRLMGNDYNYKSGYHMLNKYVDYDNPVGYDMIIHIISQLPLANPTQRVFFPEGLTFLQTLEIVTEYDFIDEEAFIQACDTGEYPFDFIEGIPVNPHRISRLEGYLFPDTYLFDITQDEEDAIYRMLANFNRKFSLTYRQRAERMGLTIDEVVIIASLIEKEARRDDERSMIAGVIYNRLKASDTSLRRLQIDATIQYYFLNETGQVKEFLLTVDTQIDHPYNTYMYDGLPPGPICNPGEMSLIAALYPDEHNFYYYVAKGDGYHAFASTYEEHLANVRRYQD